MNMVKCILVGLAMLTLSACASTSGDIPFNSFGQKVAESVVTVSNNNRDLRVCWMAAGAVEVMTDLAQKDGNAYAALGSLSLLQGAIDNARQTDALWAETDAADVTLLFAKVLKDVGRSRLSQVLLGGPTVSNFLNVAKRTIVLTVKGHAVLKDINNVLRGVEDGTIDKVVAWRACEDRTARNRNILRMMIGLSVSSMEKSWGTETVELDLIFPDGWLNGIQVVEKPTFEKQFILAGGGGGTSPFDWLMTDEGWLDWWPVDITGGDGPAPAYWPPGSTSFVRDRPWIGGTNFAGGEHGMLEWKPII